MNPFDKCSLVKHLTDAAKLNLRPLPFLTPDEETSIVAHHEAGHATIAIALGAPVVSAYIIPNGHGLVEIGPSDLNIFAHVMINLAGLAAEQVAFPQYRADLNALWRDGWDRALIEARRLSVDPSSGPSWNDLRLDFDLVQALWLPLSFHPDLSDGRLAEIFEAGFNEAIEALTDPTGRAILDRIAAALIERQSLTGDDLADLWAAT